MSTTLDKYYTMKIFEVTTSQQITEGGDSTAKRFFSELGALAAWAGTGESPSFDPQNPEQWLDASKLENPEKVFDDIRRFLTPAIELDNALGSKGKNTFGLKGYYDASKHSKDLILKDMADRGIEPPTKFGWVGGENISSVGATPSDVEFIDNEIAGVSIKDDGGVGVANLGAGELEFDGKGDLFIILAREQILELKRTVMTDLLDVVQQQGHYEAEGKPYYNMSWHPDHNVIQIIAKGKKDIAGTPDQLLSTGFLEKSNEYQRCLGDYFLKNSKKYSELSNAVLTETSVKIRDAIETKIISNAAKLAKLGGFGSSPYYYQLAKPFKVAYVPDFNTANDIEIVDITSPTRFSSGLKYKMALRRRGIEGFATVEVHIRYAQGVFGSSPTFRVQSLKGHQYLYWELLTSSK